LDRLFLDANVLFSAAYREDAPLQRFWSYPAVELISSAYAVAEAERHLDAVQQIRLSKLLTTVRVVPNVPASDLPEIKLLRGKDAPILAAAIAARAPHLVTGDRRDFGAYFGKRLGGVLVLPPRDYLGRRTARRRRRSKR